jgi:hypothetical protein
VGELLGIGGKLLRGLEIKVKDFWERLRRGTAVHRPEEAMREALSLWEERERRRLGILPAANILRRPWSEARAGT